VITTIVRTRVEVASVMTCADFCVEVLRDMGSGRSTALGVSLYTSWLGLSAAALMCCCEY
jgi:hypothetical protein